MINKQYQPSMKAEVVSEHDGTTRIRCSDEYVKSLGITDAADRAFLNDAVCGRAICPALWWFTDSDRARILLKVAP